MAPSARGFGRKMDSQIGGDIARSGKKQGTSWGKVFAIGAALAVGAKAVRFLGDSLAEAREAAEVGKRTTNVIKSMGGVANVSAKQVANLASAISLKTGIDDEAIQSGQNLLLTFGNIRNEAGKGNDIFSQTTSLMVDMSAAMGTDAKGSAIQLGKALNDPIKGVSALTRVGVAFTDQQKEQIKKLVESGHTLKAQKIILGEVKKEFGGAAEAMASPADKAKVAFGNLKEEIGTFLLPLIDRFLTFLTDKIIPGISDFAKKVKRFFKGVAEPVQEFFDSAAGHAAVATSFGLIATAAGLIKSGISGAARGAKKLADAIGSIDFENLDSKKVGEFLGKAVATGLNTLITLVPKVTAKLGEMFGKVDWVGIGIAMGKQVPALLIGLAAGILNFDLGSLLSGLAAHWQEILLAIVTIAFAPAWFGKLLGRLLIRIPFVGKFLSASVLWLSELGGKLATFGEDLLKAMWKGFTGGKALPGAGIVTKVLAALKGLPGKVGEFFDLLRIRVGIWALQAFEAIGSGARTAIVGVLKFVVGIPGKILNAIGNVSKFLFPKGTALIEGLWDGLKGKIVEVFGWVKALPGRVVTAVGNVANLLYEKGAALIAGFARGMMDKLQDAYNAAKKIADKIAGLFPGSPIKEGPLKSWNNGGAGKLLVGMLAKGIRDGAPQAETAFENVTQALVDKIKEKLKTVRDAFKDLKGQAKDLRDSVASAFSTDLFSSETLADFISGGLAAGNQLLAVQAAIQKLRDLGVSADFLTALGQSGNAGLAIQLASASPEDLAAAQVIFAQNEAMAQAIGNNVADAKFGDAIAKLERRMETLQNSIENISPNRTGEAVARALNGVASGGRRNANQGRPVWAAA